MKSYIQKRLITPNNPLTLFSCPVLDLYLLSDFFFLYVNKQKIQMMWSLWFPFSFWHVWIIILVSLFSDMICEGGKINR